MLAWVWVCVCVLWALLRCDSLGLVDFVWWRLSGFSLVWFGLWIALVMYLISYVLSAVLVVVYLILVVLIALVFCSRLWFGLRGVV